MTVRREPCPAHWYAGDGKWRAANGISISRNLPLLVELAIATDGLIIVFIMGMLARAVQNISARPRSENWPDFEGGAGRIGREGDEANKYVVILLFPLVAAALVCLPFKRFRARGVTCFLSGRFVLPARLACRIDWRRRRHHAQVRRAKMDRGRRFERADFAPDRVCRTTAAIFSIGYMAPETLSRQTTALLRQL